MRCAPRRQYDCPPARMTTRAVGVRERNFFLVIELTPCRVANNGRIPDAATIHAMRKRREQLRKLKSMNVIPLEDVDPVRKPFSLSLSFTFFPWARMTSTAAACSARRTRWTTATLTMRRTARPSRLALSRLKRLRATVARRSRTRSNCAPACFCKQPLTQAW